MALLKASKDDRNILETTKRKSESIKVYILLAISPAGDKQEFYPVLQSSWQKIRFQNWKHKQVSPAYNRCRSCFKNFFLVPGLAAPEAQVAVISTKNNHQLELIS